MMAARLPSEQKEPQRRQHFDMESDSPVDVGLVRKELVKRSEAGVGAEIGKRHDDDQSVLEAVVVAKKEECRSRKF